MALAHDVFEEHSSVISALRDNYVRKDDTNAVLSIVRVQEELAALCSGREEQVKQSIRELGERVQEAEVQATYPEAEGAHEGRVDDLTAATEEAKENKEREGLKEKFGELRKKSEQLEQLISDAEPRTRHQLSLYAHISKITWHFDQRDMVAGTISNPARGDIRKFELDVGQLGEFEVVNRLWDMMDGRQ